MKKKLILFSLIFFTLSLYSIKYKITEFDNVKIYSQESISEEIIEKFNNYFEIAYKSIGTDLGFPETKPKIYIYQTDNELYDELLNTRHYPTWFKTYNVLPRMNKDYEMWALFNKDIKFIAHEYSHRIIERIAGINSQVNFKWLDEGLAEYEGIQALSIYDSKKGLDKKEQFLKSTIEFYKNGILIKICDMTTEDQWIMGMKEYQDKYYIQSYIMINYLVEEFGINKIKELLELIQKETIFSNAFKKVYGTSLNEFEKIFSIYLEKIKIEKEKNKVALKFDFTKDNNEWENINPIIDDKNDNIDIPEADIRNIHAEIFKDQLYILFTTESKINTKSLIAHRGIAATKLIFFCLLFFY